MDKFKRAGKILNQGAADLASGKIEEAIKSFLKAIKIDDKLVAAHFNLALAYHQKGDVLKAIPALERTIQLKTNDFEALNLLGHLYMSQQRGNEALACFQKATTINPFLAEGFYNLGVVYMNQGRLNDALKNYQQSLKLFPDNAIVLNNVGVAYEKMAKIDQAKKFFKKSIKINSQNAMAFTNLGAIYIYIDPQKAKGYFEKAVAADPKMENAIYNLGVCLRILGDTEGSIKCLEKALKLNPNFSPTYGLLYHQVREICDWPRAKKMESQMKKMTYEDLQKGNIPAETIFVSVVYDDNPKRNYEIAKAWSSYIERKVIPFNQPYSFKDRVKAPTSPSPKAGLRGARKIRIGYLSNDFRNHATAHLIMGLFRLHDRKKFEIYTYSYGENDKSHYRKEIEKITRFRDVLTLSYRQAADLIYKDKIDILVDLKGHTTNSRLEIPALRPAPVQVHYLGFPGTSGAKFLDYLITDKIVTPKSHLPYYQEKLIFLPHSYQVNDNQQPISKEKLTREKIMLPENIFLFCCFNQPYKIDPQAFTVWMRILKRIPNGGLCFLAKTNSQIENLRREAQKRGVNPNRLFFSLPLAKDVHLKRLTLFDLALDTFTCNGHTTTSDCLWAGTPVIALQGKHFASRVSASLLTAIGLPELITRSPKEYEALAVKLAKSPKSLKSLKEKLATNRLKMSLFDTPKFTKHLEEAYERIWGLYLEGKKPKHITIKD
jgi:protein O-GlcNAc transferase